MSNVAALTIHFIYELNLYNSLHRFARSSSNLQRKISLLIVLTKPGKLANP